MSSASCRRSQGQTPAATIEDPWMLGLRICSQNMGDGWAKSTWQQCDNWNGCQDNWRSIWEIDLCNFLCILCCPMPSTPSMHQMVHLWWAANQVMSICDRENRRRPSALILNAPWLGQANVGKFKHGGNRTMTICFLCGAFFVGKTMPWSGRQYRSRMQKPACLDIPPFT